uniref:Uncharacterized protein n=1 Tax=Phasianus colchicus TaxID=9054 RepID=A0A669PZ30_PHACC
MSGRNKGCKGIEKAGTKSYLTVSHDNIQSITKHVIHLPPWCDGVNCIPGLSYRDRSSLQMESMMPLLAVTTPRGHLDKGAICKPTIQGLDPFFVMFRDGFLWKQKKQVGRCTECSELYPSHML